MEEMEDLLAACPLTVKACLSTLLAFAPLTVRCMPI
jgi:hypothetical protein